MSNIQDLFNRNKGDLLLTPGEYEGPLIINHPCTVDGQNSTLWADKGPVLVVASPSVTLKNLRIEITGNHKNGQQNATLRLNYGDTKLENIEINGYADGLPQEDTDWGLPSVISLGEFAANKENSFSVEIDAPREAEIFHNIKDVVISPQKIRPGHNVINIVTGNIRDNTILFGELLLKSAVARRFYITGRSLKTAPERRSALAVSQVARGSSPRRVNAKVDVVAPANVGDNNSELVNRGQRISLSKFIDKTLKIEYSQRSASRSLAIDPYIFLLGQNGKVRSDNDLVFFGNEEAENRAVRVKTGGSGASASFELSRVSEDVNKIVVCMSIYDDKSGANFSNVEAPMIRVFSGRDEKFRFKLDGLQREKTVVAVELYRYKGEWKANFVGYGFNYGLDVLCRDYGVEVE